MKKTNYLSTLLSCLVMTTAAFCRADETNLDQIRALATKGDAQAQYELGKDYLKKRDYKDGAEYLTKAAGQGIAAAENDLGRLYILGQGVTPDAVTANQWFLKAADGGDELGMYNLACSYEQGRGTTNDLSKAITYYRQAAEKNMPEAENRLGEMYTQGVGVDKDLTEAAKWFQKAANHGLARAQNNLGACYESGQGVPVNLGEAMRLYNLAAEGGNAKAQFTLGMYCRGKTPVSEKNLAKAYFWLTISGESGFPAGNQQRVDLLTMGVMTPEDMTEAKRLIAEYHGKHPRELP
jgi:uncharacterized protein